MTIGMYTTRAMDEHIALNPPEVGFLRRTFAPDRETHNTEAVDIDIMKGGRRLAPIVSSDQPGKLMKPDQFKTNTIKPGYIKDLMVMKPRDTYERMAGENVYSPLSPAQRALKKLDKYLREQYGRVDRRIEWMVAQALVNGEIDLVGEGVNTTVNFSRSASHDTTPTVAWIGNPTTCTPLTDMRAWAFQNLKDGLIPSTDHIMRLDAYEALLASDQIQAYLDKRNIFLGEIDSKNMTGSATLMGNIENRNIWVYEDWYTPDGGGSLVPFIPDGGVLTGTRDSRVMKQHFGAIEDFDADFVEAEVFPKSWVQKDPSRRHILVQSVRS